MIRPAPLTRFLEAWLERRRTVVWGALTLILAGAWLASRLPLEWVPSLELPRANIQAFWPGASPRLIEQRVTGPIERTLTQVRGIRDINSFSRVGHSQISLELDDERPAAVIIAEISDRLAALQKSLPVGVRPRIDRQVPEELEDEVGFMTLQMTGPYEAPRLLRLAKDRVAPRLRSLGGIAELDIEGGRELELRITLHPARLSAHGIEPSEVEQRLLTALESRDRGRLVSTDGRTILLLSTPLRHRAELAALPVGVSSRDQLVRLSDVAEVRVESAPTTSISRIDGRSVISLALERTPDSHLLEVAKQVRQALTSLSAELPSDITLTVAEDRSEPVRESLQQLAFSSAGALALITAVLLWMLPTGRAIATVYLSMGVSLAVACGAMAILGLSINLLTLAGLAMILGLLVDNAVVVAERLTIERRRTDDPLLATRRTLRAVALPLLGGTLTTLIVLAPLTYLSGELRGLFVPFGILTAATLSLSLLASFLLIPAGQLALDKAPKQATKKCPAPPQKCPAPALVAPVEKCLAPPQAPSQKCQAPAFEALPEKCLAPTQRRLAFARQRLALTKQPRLMSRFLEAPLAWTARHPVLSLLILALLFGLPTPMLPDVMEEPSAGWDVAEEQLAERYNRTLGSDGFRLLRKWLDPLLGGVLGPFLDEVHLGQSWKFANRPEIRVSLALPQGSGAEKAEALVRHYEDKAMASPAVAHTHVRVMEDRAILRVLFPEGANESPEPIRLRQELIEQALHHADAEISIVGLVERGFHSGLGDVSGFLIEAQGPSYEGLGRQARQLAGRLQRDYRVASVDLEAGRYGRMSARESLRLDWSADARARTGLETRDLSNMLQSWLRHRGTRYEADLEGTHGLLPVRIEMADVGTRQLAELLQRPLPVDGATIKLGEEARLSLETQPPAIERLNQQYQRYIRVYWRGPRELGKELIDQELAGLKLPPGYRLERPEFTFFDEQTSYEFLGLLAATWALIYLVLAAVFESWRLPILVFCSVPLSFIGVAGGFLLTGAAFAEGAFMGLVLLVGISANDGVLLVDRYRVLRLRRPITEATTLVRLAVRQRLRPMWTTTLTSIAGVIPLLVITDGADFWLGFAVTVAGGLLASTLLIPVVTVALIALGVDRPHAVRLRRYDSSTELESTGFTTKLLSTTP